MGGFKEGNFSDRLTTAANAKKAQLEKVREKLRAANADSAERDAARIAAHAAKEARIAERTAEKAARAAEAKERAEREAAEKAALEAQLKEQKAREAVEKAASESALEAERKAARDARYAARKKRK